MRARLNGIQAMMGKFDFLFGLSLNAHLLGKVDIFTNRPAEGQDFMIKCFGKLADL